MGSIEQERIDDIASPKNRLRVWVTKRPLLIFLILLEVIHISSMGIFLTQQDSKSILMVVFLLVAGSSPTIAYFIIMHVVGEETENIQRRKKWIAFGISWVITTLLCVLVFLFLEIKTGYDVHLISNLTPALTILICCIFGLFPAFVFGSVYSNNRRLRNSLTSLVRPRGKIRYYLIAFLLPVIISIASIFIYLEAHNFWIPNPDEAYRFLPRMGTSIIYLIFSLLFRGSLIEEIGWTGFVLPQLQKRFSPLVASVFMGLIWSIWHIAPFQIFGGPDDKVFLPAHLFLLGFVPFSFIYISGRIILTWLYNKTEGGLIPVILFHGAHNFFPSGLRYSFPFYVICAIIMVIESKMWRKISSIDP